MQTTNESCTIDWEKYPLLPAIVQDAASSKVLMLAYMNKEAYELTKSTGYAHYFSRSKGRIWKKGEESGNVQKVQEIFLDCDCDAILLQAEQVGGAACHTGRESCFFTKASGEIVGEQVFDPSEKYNITDRLYHSILEKRNGDPEKSYTAKLYKKGENTILKKVVEEAGEFCFAIKDNTPEEIISEAADLAYHLLVALSYRDISPYKIEEKLKSRFGVSGIDEKKSRKE